MFGLFKRGSIEIIPEKFLYSPGEIIRGVVRINLKKPTQARAFAVRFTGIEVVTTGARGTNTISVISVGTGDAGINRRTTQTVIYQFELPLAGESVYTTHEYPFEILIPETVMPENANSVPGGTVGNVLNQLGFGIDRTVRTLQWSLTAELDIPGAINMKKSIDIQLKAA